MRLLRLPQDCPACRALGAELCPECSEAVRASHAPPDAGTTDRAPARTDPDLTLRQASVVLAHVRRFAPDAYSDAVDYAREYLTRD